MFRLLYDLYTWSLSFALATLLLNILFIAMCIFSVIGIIATIMWFSGRKKNKTNETPGEYWRRTGRMK